MTRKKILIFTSAGGHGHMAVTQALLELFKDEYDIVVSDIFNDVLCHIDPLWRLTKKKSSGTTCYNYLMTRGHNKLLSFMYYIGLWYYAFCNQRVRTLLKKHITTINPDLIISVIPVVNGYLAQVTYEMGIKMLIIPTDLDPTTFVVGIKKQYSPHITCTLYFADNDAINIISSTTGITTNNIKISGPILRNSFLLPQSKKNNIPGTPIRIMVMMGSLGVNNLIDIVKSLITIPTPLTLMVCIGKNKTLAHQLADLICPKNITLEIIGFTNDIASLMATSDLFVTKTGTTSVAEAIAMRIPMILDATKTAVTWEHYNRNFINTHGLGLVATTHTELITMVSQLIHDKELYTNICNRLHNFTCLHFHATLPSLIKTLIH